MTLSLPRVVTAVLAFLSPAMLRRVTPAGVLAAVLLAACAPARPTPTGSRLAADIARPGSTAARPAVTSERPGPTVLVPWRAGNAGRFQMGTVEEHRAGAAHGSLPVTIARPAGVGPFPFVVLLHGCGGLRYEATWSTWVRPWVELFRGQGIATAVVDSFGPRGVVQVCTRDVAAWATRRADDAYSARAWLAEQPDVDAGRIAVMGMSNGGRTVLAALRAAPGPGQRFVAGIPLYPGCRTDVGSAFYAPLLVLIGEADTVTPARFCEQMRAARPASAPALEVVVYPGGPHAFDMRLPDRRVLGMRLGHDAHAEADARRRVIGFLAAHGLVAPRRSQP